MSQEGLIYPFMFILGMVVFCSVRSHLLLSLLSLEYLVVVLFVILVLFINNFGSGGYFVMVYLTFSVCESCLGLGVLVLMIRCHGNDNLNSMSMLSW